MIQKIAIFGGTGMTGLCALEHAVKKGLSVRALVRDKLKIPENLRDKVEVLEGDVLNYEQVEKAITGVDGVVVVLGTRNDLKPTTVLSEGMKNIINAMKAKNVQLVSVCLSAFLFYQVDKVPAIFKDLNADHQRMLDVVKESELKWIAVCPPHISHSESRKFNYLHGSSPGREITKFDLGSFLVDSLENPEHCQKICGIANV